MTAILCAALSALLFYFSQGLDDVWLLAWLAPIPLLWLAYGSEPRWRVGLASFAAFAAGQIYLLQCYAAYLPPVVLVAIPAVLSTAFAGTISFSGFVYRRAGVAPAVLAFPCSWTAFEYLFAQISPHGTFGSIAYSQVSMPLLIQSASLFGLYAITFLICLAANAIALLIRGGVRVSVPAGIALAICIFAVVWGAARLGIPQTNVVRVAALSDVKIDADANRARTQAASVATASIYADAIGTAARKGARFVVTPEGGIPIHSVWRNAAYAPLAAAAQQTGAQIVAGIYDPSPAEDIAVTFRPDGQTSTYAKRHTLLPLEAEFKRGRSPGLLGGGRAVAICKDMDFPQTLRGDAASGDIRIMAVPAGDFVTDGWIHARMAMMRGVENGFAVVRSANDGLLTISDAEGRLAARKTADPHAGMSMVVADVSLGPGATLYTHIGDVLPWTSIALTLLLGALALGRLGAKTPAYRPAVSETS